MPTNGSVWSIDGLEERFRELVHGGVLVEERDPEGKDGLARVLQALSKEFEAELKSSGYRLTEQSLRKKLASVIWGKEVMDLIKTVVHKHRPLSEFLEHCPWIPERIAARKYRELGGITGTPKTAEFKAGFGRIAGAMEDMVAEGFMLSRGTYDTPIKLDVGQGDTVLVLNGVNLGVPYGGLIEDNPARRALEYAERKGCRAVFLANFLDIDVTKAAGVLTVYRALVSGRNINTKTLVPSYAKKAQLILDQRPRGSIVYQTTEEMFLDSLRGWEKLSTKPNGKPEFSGPIFIVLGRKEEEFIAAATYWEANYWTRIKQNKLDVDILIATKALAKARADGDRKAILGNEERLRELQDERARTIISNVQDGEWKTYFRQVVAYFVRKLEAAIPNSKVVSVGSAFVRTEHGTFEIHIPDHLRVTDALLADYTRTYGPKVLRGRMADLVAISHPYSLGYRTTVREKDTKGVRGSSEVVVAPITVDEDFIRQTIEKGLYTSPGIGRAVKNELFEAGCLKLEFVNDMIMPVNLPLSVFSPTGRKTNQEPKYLWMMVNTDPHYGSPTREMLKLGEGLYRGSGDAAIEMMRRAGLCKQDNMPVHMFMVNDDPTQGHNVSYQKQPHPKKAPFAVLEDYMRKLVEKADQARDIDEVRTIVRNGVHVIMTQLWRRGEYWTQDQMLQVMDQLIEPNLDFYDAILSRAARANVHIKGISEFESDGSDFVYDTRDPGLINIGTGNHFAGGVERELTEGVLYVAKLRSLLRTVPKWRDKKELIDQLVRAPLYGNLFVAYGVVQTDGGYPWVLDLRSSPPKMAGWEDPLRGWVNIDLRRGNYSRIQDIGKTIKVCGDKHFFCVVNTPYALYHMSPPDTPTDSFAEWAGGFPPNNTGVSFIGLPVDGPDSAPIIVRSLRYDRMKEYFEGEGTDFDWEAFLPNPA